jgi:hypothetical protein
MYRCKTSPLGSRKSKRVLAEAYGFIDAWRAESRGSRPYAKVKFMGRRKKVFIDDFHHHIESKNLRDTLGRYRLLPCVRELLRNTTDAPTRTTDGNWMLDGLTPEGRKFHVIIRPEKKGGCLQSFYPV